MWGPPRSVTADDAVCEYTERGEAIYRCSGGWCGAVVAIGVSTTFTCASLPSTWLCSPCRPQKTACTSTSCLDRPSNPLDTVCSSGQSSRMDRNTAMAP